jgi:hypothetical protein
MAASPVRGARRLPAVTETVRVRRTAQLRSGPLHFSFTISRKSRKMNQERERPQLWAAILKRVSPETLNVNTRSTFSDAVTMVTIPGQEVGLGFSREGGGPDLASECPYFDVFLFASNNPDTTGRF